MGNQNRVSFQIAPCQPFIDECGFNHENSFIIQNDRSESKVRSDIGELSFQCKIFPNPSKGSPELNISSNQGIRSIEIYNVYGSIIYSNNNISNESIKLAIPLKNFSKGIYFISIKPQNGDKSNMKFIID
ncbi:MAG: T9SS type A sorting domain-containing protein [Flavobacteriales bacterium]|nr:T9SS type A sorting domain-containing protein [Flavobacteriales bacterium]